MRGAARRGACAVSQRAVSACSVARTPSWRQFRESANYAYLWANFGS